MKRRPPQFCVRVLGPLVWLITKPDATFLTYPTHRLNPFCECLSWTKYDWLMFILKFTGFPQLCIVSNSDHSKEGFNESEILNISYPSKWSVNTDTGCGLVIALDGVIVSFLQLNKTRKDRNTRFFIDIF